MVAKRAGQFAGGFLNNPGALAAIGIVVSIITTLVIFRNDIRDFFGGIGEGFGQIQLPAINLPDITFPTFEFPDITFPSFPDITFPSFPDINITFPSFEDFFMVPDPFVEPERMDVPFGDTGETIDIVPDVTGGRGERLREVIDGEVLPDPNLALEPSDAELFARDFPEVFVSEPDFSIVRELEEVPFAVANVEETQAEFQERAAAFAEVLPGVTFSTSIDPGIVFGRQLSRESESFEDVLAAEARRSETIFAGLFGNVQNPEFGA